MGNDKQWGEFNRIGLEYLKSGSFGLYRNIRFDMAMFLKREGRYSAAISMFSEVCYWDLSGCDNNYYEALSIGVPVRTLVPYGETGITVAPGIVREIGICQRKLKLSDEELQEKMLTHIKKLSAHVQYFTPEEIVDIIFWERDSNSGELRSVYEAAILRYNG